MMRPGNIYSGKLHRYRTVAKVKRFVRFSGFITLAAWLNLESLAFAVQLEDLDPTRQWRVGSIEIVGHESLSRDELDRALLTRPRPWFRFWSEPPVFDPVTFREDLQRLRRLYEANGFYETEISYDLTPEFERELLSARIAVSEGSPIMVAEVDVGVAGVASFPEDLPIKTGDRFSEQAYRQGETTLQQFYAERGHAYIESERSAEIVLDTDQAFIVYKLDPGPVGVFGATRIAGTQAVAPEIVRRELAYEEGEIYSLKKIAESREKLLALDLFGTVRVAPQQSPGKPTAVPMEVRVTEREPREFRFSVGYGSEDRFRTQIEWRHNNWLGDGRRLSILVKYSGLESSGAATFVQPHLLSRRGRGVMTLRHDRTDEDTYLLQATRFQPRFEYRLSERLSGFVGYRVEHNQFSDLDSATVNALGGVDKRGLISGPTLGLTWNSTDDLLYPTRGERMLFSVDQAGVPWGGRYRFYRLNGEANKYWSLGWQTIFAARLKLGFADAIGAERRLPLSERLYSGGQSSVRGYGRRRLGPLSPADDPLGGLSLIEGSVELRRPLWNALGGALFIDFGQVSRRAFDVPVDRLKFAAGFGLSYTTPVGPLRLDVGFPFAPPRGDRSFAIHFNVGASF